jgi:hypothetical protein
MKAIETTATVNNLGQLTLDEPLTFTNPGRIRIILLIAEEEDPVNDSLETIREGIYQGWQEARHGQTQPIAELWKGIDVD